MINEIYSIDLELEQLHKKIGKLEDRREKIMKDYEEDLWKKRGKKPLPMSKVREEFAN